MNQNIDKQLDEVFFKKPKFRIKLSERKDVLNKGSLRLLRKVFRHLFTTMFEHKRKRTKPTKAKQFEDFLNKFKAVWSDHLSYTHSENQIMEDFELIGRLINNGTYNLLSDEYLSTKSQKIKNFVIHYDKCCINYSHSYFESIVKSKFFKNMVNLYQIINKKGFLMQYKVINKDNYKYKDNLEHIQDIIS